MRSDFISNSTNMDENTEKKEGEETTTEGGENNG